MQAIFGPAGQCERSRKEGVKATEGFLRYLAGRGATAFEYQCGRGVNVGEEKARQYAAVAGQLGIRVSIHAPYYISLASREEQKRLNSVEYIVKSARAVDWMGGDRIVVHPGGLNKFERPEATALACETLRMAQEELDKQGLAHVHMCIETMGKVNQLGSLEEVLTMCAIDPRLLPCVDFGHLNARTHGALDAPEKFEAVLAQIGESLGGERMRAMHIHFSKIEYSAGGEVRHLTFEDTQFGPNFENLVDALVQYRMHPVVISESAGTQTDDALAMQAAYLDALHGAKQ